MFWFLAKYPENQFYYNIDLGEGEFFFFFNNCFSQKFLSGIVVPERFQERTFPS